MECNECTVYIYKFITNKDDVYFKKACELRFVPPAALINSELSSLDAINASPICTMVKPDNFVFGASGAGNNWTKAHCTEIVQLIGGVVDVIRNGAESCDCPQGFQIRHSLGGGTGSGSLVTLLMKIGDNCCDRFTATFSVYQSPKVSDVVVEPNKATLSIHQFLENSDEIFVLDNEVLHNISHDMLRPQQPKFTRLNWVISLVMSCVIAASLRFSGKLNGDLRKMGINFVFFQRLHFFAIVQAPLFGPGDAKHVEVTVQEKTDEMLSSYSLLANVKPEDALGYRGNNATLTWI